MFDIDYYETERGDSPLREFLKDLSQSGKKKDVAQIMTAIKRLQEYGMELNRYFPETIRKIDESLYELRPKSNRVFFFIFTGSTFVLLHAYKKKSMKAPKIELDKAEKEMKSYLRRKEYE